MAVNTTQGAQIYIGPENDTADELADFTGLSYTRLGEAEDLGEFGDQANEVLFTAIADARTRKLKGAFNAGTMNVVVGLDADDAGQDAMAAALASKHDFAFKVVLPDGSTGSPSTGTTFYFRGKVMAKSINLGTVDNVMRRSFPIGINSEVFEVAAI